MKTCAKVFVSVLLLAPVAVFGEKTTTWQGAANGVWSVPANWDNGKPESGDTVVLTGTSSVNDIAGLSLAALQFTGDGALTLSGEAVTLSGGADALAASGAGTKTIAADLVLPAGETTVTLGSGVRVSVTGVISGAGKLKIEGANGMPGNYQNYVTGAATWLSIVELRAANTYAGGTACNNVTIDVYDLHGFGREETAIAFNGYGMLWFRASGDFRYDVLGSSTSLWLTFSAFPVTLYGAVVDEVANATLNIIGREDSNRIVNFRGEVRVPNGTVQGGNKFIHSHFYAPVTATTVSGNRGAFGGAPAYMHFHAAGNAFANLKLNAYLYAQAETANAWPQTAVASYTSYAPNSTIDLGGYDQVLDRVYTISAQDTPARTARTITSSAAATLTCQATADAAFFNGQVTGAATLEWAPATARTLTLSEIDFTGTTGLRVSSGTVALGSGVTFAAGTTVFVESGATLTVAEETAYTVKWLYKDGLPQQPGVACAFGNGTIAATELGPLEISWTGGAGADDAVSNPLNWSANPSAAEAATARYTFAKDGSTATLDVDKTVRGVRFAGRERFTVSGPGTLTVGEAGLEVANGVAATLDGGADVRLAGTGRTSVAGSLTITNATVVAYDVAAPQTFASEYDRAITVGRGGDGILRVRADAVVTNRLVLGSRESGMTGDGYQAAAYFDGGETVLIGSRDHSTGKALIPYGTGAQCYMRIAGDARVTAYDSAQFQSGTENAILRLDGGELDVLVGSGTAFNQTSFDGVAGSGLGTFYVKNGTFRDAVKSHMMDQGTGQGVWTVSEGGTMTFKNALYFCYNVNRLNTRGSIFNVKDGGHLTYSSFYAPPSYFPLWATNAVGEHVYRPVYLNLNGGTLECQNPNGTGYPMFEEIGGVTVVNRVTVFKKGVTVVTRAGFRVHQPFEAPTGMGVTNIPWTAQAGFVAPPSVWIEGDGYGASAIACFDEATGTVTGFEVTSPGCDYTWARAHVMKGPRDLAAVDCALAENDRTGALRFGGTVNHMVGLATHGPWTVGEVVFDRAGIFRFMQETDDVFSTNTIVTLKTSNGILDGSTHSDWPQYADGAHRIQVGTIRGTDGHVLGASDLTVHASFLDLAGSGDIGFYNHLLSVEGTWEVDGEELAARAAESLENGKYKTDVAFAPTARIRLKNAEALDGNATYVLAQTDASHTLTVDGQVLAAPSLPTGWKLVVTGNVLKLKPNRGMLLIVR